MTDSDLPELPEGAFAKPDAGDGPAFYAPPRLVIHIDAGAVAALTGLYRKTLPEGGHVHAASRSELAHPGSYRDAAAACRPNGLTPISDTRRAN